MIDHILGRPSPTLRRSQIFLILFFWIWRLYKGDGASVKGLTPSRTATSSIPRVSAAVRGVRGSLGKGRGRWLFLLRFWRGLVGKGGYGMGWVGRINQRLRHFTPYQLILGSFTLVYALRHVGDLFGLGAPEPHARMYSRSYYRATYVNTALDAGFASAMAIRPKWLKDLCSVLFGVYYLVWATEGDEVLRRFRALCTVEMLRVTWEKTNNPYIRLATTFHRPSLPVVRYVSIPRPATSSRSSLPPVKGILFFSGTEAQLAKATQLVIDFPGGGFIAMGPECHEERLRAWAKRTGKPVLGIDYGKAPEYPYPWAIEEGFDAYRTLMETKGKCIGIDSGKLGIVLTGDSAGGNICATIMLRILEHPTGIPRPISMILAYPALDFNFTSWMSPANLKVLRTEQSEVQIPGLVHGKDHMRHKSPLSVVDDVEVKKSRVRHKSWGETIVGRVPGLVVTPSIEKGSGLERGSKSGPSSPVTAWSRTLPRTMSMKVAGWLGVEGKEGGGGGEGGEGSDGSDSGSEDEDAANGVKRPDARREADKALKERVKTPREERRFELTPVHGAAVRGDETNGDEGKLVVKKRKKAPIGTRLTMTSRVGYFQDRIISPSMMRAMAILYIGPRSSPDFETDYYISPILSPPHLLAHFPPVYLICGERDPFVDDTIIFAGKIREAKRTRRSAAQTAQESKSARFGESLRMSTSSTQSRDGPTAPDHIIRENDDDWVQMRIIEGWGHGFMQMTSLMKEVDAVLAEMADWIDESFVKAEDRDRDIRDVEVALRVVRDREEVLSPMEHLPVVGSRHVKTVGEYKKATEKILGGADMGSGLLGGGRSGEARGVVEERDEGDTIVTFTPKTRKRNPPPSKFAPVPRRPSKEALNLHRSPSAPKFDGDDTGSSGEAMSIRTPPLGARSLPLSEGTPRGSGAFAFFNSSRTGGSVPIGGSTSRGPGSSVGITPGTGTAASKPQNSLVAAAVAGARAASPALAAAGLVPQSISSVTEAELMRRRRMEAVFGLGGMGADDEEDTRDDLYEED